MTRFSLLALVVVTAAAHAQPAPSPAPPPSGDRVDAKSLVQTGVRLLEVKDYLGALAIFKDAYARFPSAKILLNIGTTYKLLGRDADAANAYQRYLDSGDADAARRQEVGDVIADLDKKVGRVSITVTPADAEVQIGDEWLPAASVTLWRAAPGTFSIQVRKDGFEQAGQTTNITAGGEAVMSVALVATPEPVAIVAAPRGDDDLAIVETEGPRSRIGAIAIVHVSVIPKLGSAWLVGGTFDVTTQLTIDAALLLGPGLVSDGMASLPPPSFGGYAGARFSLVTGKLRPRIAAGGPLFAREGARVFVRGAGGIEYVATRHFSIAAELGAEIALNPQNDIRDIAVVPALGVSGRL